MPTKKKPAIKKQFKGYDMEDKNPLYQFTDKRTGNRITWNGVKFMSKTEMYFYQILFNLKIKFEFQVPLELIPPARADKQYRLTYVHTKGAGMVVDFIFADQAGNKYFVDTKGSRKFVDPLSTFKYKLLKYKLIQDQQYDSQIKFVEYKDVIRIYKAAFSEEAFWHLFLRIKPF